MLQPKIILLGATGMLGHKMVQRLSRTFPEMTCTLQGRLQNVPFAHAPLFKQVKVVEGVDVSNFEALSTLLSSIRPEVIVNCTGIIKQRDAAHAHIPSLKINSLLPHQLANLSAEWGGRLIHFSTDCVFSGNKGMYLETDLSDAEDLYGRTKYLGETVEENALTLRTSIIGRELQHHRSLLDWFLSNRDGKVRGYRKSIYSGVTTNHLADVVCDVIVRFPQLHGLYQVVSNAIAKCDLLRLLADAYGVAIAIEDVDGENVDRSMDGSKFCAATGYSCPSWAELVKELAADATPYGEWLRDAKWSFESR